MRSDELMRIHLKKCVQLLGVTFSLIAPDAATSQTTQPGASQAQLQQHVTYLAGIQPTRSANNIASLNEAADYVQQNFATSGGTVEQQYFTVGEDELRNIRCSFGAGKDRYVVGAHYDSYSETPGADDNASGVAGILELARMLGRAKPDLDYKIDLVAFTLEEPPHFARASMGSAVYAHTMGPDVKGMISVEMIGYFSDEPNSQKLPIQGLASLIYPTTGNFIGMVGRIRDGRFMRRSKRAFARSSALPVEILAAPTVFEAITFSDHRNFWAKGVPAYMVTDTSFLRTPHYHQASDTPDTLDYPRMKQVVDGLYSVITNF